MRLLNGELMNTKPLFACFLLCLCASRAEAKWCTLTVDQLVERRRPEPVEIYRTRELVPIAFREVVAAADLIVEGIVHPVRTYVSDDGCGLYTEHAVTTPRVLVGRHRSPSQPGASLLFRQWGGEMTIRGVKVIFRDEQLPPLQGGEHVVLFLAGPDKNGVYDVVQEVVGAFQLVGGRAKALTRPANLVHGEFADVAMTDFVAEIKRLKRR